MKRELPAILFGILAIGFSNLHAQNAFLERGRQAYENMTPAQQAEIKRAVTSGDQIRFKRPADAPAPSIPDSLENAKKLHDMDRSPEAFRMYGRLANNGNLEAQVAQATFYIHGVGTSVDEEKGNRLMHDAASKGSGQAAQRIGMDLFAKGNTKDGIGWLELAARRDEPFSQVSIGSYYENGPNVKHDYKKAVGWYKRAVANGYELGFYQLAKMYEAGKGVKKNKLLAAAIYPMGQDYDLSRLKLQSTLRANEISTSESMREEIKKSSTPILVIEKFESGR